MGTLGPMDGVVWPRAKPLRCLRVDMATELVVEVWGASCRGLLGHPHAPTPMGVGDQGGQEGQNLKI